MCQSVDVRGWDGIDRFGSFDLFCKELIPKDEKQKSPKKEETITKMSQSLSRQIEGHTFLDISREAIARWR